MLELYPTEKFHFSSEIQVAEVEKVMISPKIPYVIYMGNLLGNPGKSKGFQLQPPVSPS